jgi:hypothetical protein
MESSFPNAFNVAERVALGIRSQQSLERTCALQPASS